MAKDLTADEYALYDRQVRLWGAQAQQTIGKSHVLIISMRAVGAEVAKNLTLAGVAALTIVDDSPVGLEDLGACYFLREEDIGKPRAQCAIPRLNELNPRVKINDGGTLSQLFTADQAFYSEYTAIVVCDLFFDVLSMINIATRLAARPFYATGIHGEYGYIFADLIDHQYVVERDQSNKPAVIGTQESTTRSVIGVQSRKEAESAPKEILTKRELYCPLILANSSSLDPSITGNKRKVSKVPPLLPALRALFDFQRMHTRNPDSNSQIDLATFTASAKSHAQQLLLPDDTLTADFLRSFLPSIGTEIITTASFIGSRLSEDLINAITQREQPIQNFAFYDSESGPIYCLYSPPPEAILGTSIPVVASNPTATTTMNPELTLTNGKHLPETGEIKFP